MPLRPWKFSTISSKNGILRGLLQNSSFNNFLNRICRFSQTLMRFPQSFTNFWEFCTNLRYIHKNSQILTARTTIDPIRGIGEGDGLNLQVNLPIFTVGEYPVMSAEPCLAAASFDDTPAGSVPGTVVRTRSNRDDILLPPRARDFIILFALP